MMKANNTMAQHREMDLIQLGQRLLDLLKEDKNLEPGHIFTIIDVVIAVLNNLANTDEKAFLRLGATCSFFKKATAIKREEIIDQYIPTRLKLPFQIGVFGDNNSGKKSLISRFEKNDFYETKEQKKRTKRPIIIGYLYETRKLLKDDGIIPYSIILRIDEIYKELHPYEGQNNRYDALIVTFDPSSDTTNLHTYLNTLTTTYGKQLPIYVVATKVDQKALDQQQLSDLKDKYEKQFFAISAKTGEGLNELFSAIKLEFFSEAGIKPLKEDIDSEINKLGK